MKCFGTVICAALIGLAAPASAEFRQITTRTDFMNLVSGKTLTRPLIKLRVLPDGMISGKGATREVTGKWSWERGFFCRSLTWGDKDLPYNCQEIKSDGSRLRIISDKGSGESAEFKLR